jgi:putative cell wall-binding protein
VVTGATDLQIKNAVVDGALYSTYTLWHLVNGDIRKVLSNCTIEKYNSKMEQQLMLSDNTKSVIFALKQFDDQEYVDRFQEIIRIMKKDYPLINFYIAKNLPSEVFLSEENIKSLNQIWQLLDPNTQSILEDYLNFE